MVHQCRNVVENDAIAIEVDINIKQNEEIEKIIKELKSEKSFGKVEVGRTKIAMNRKISLNMNRIHIVDLEGNKLKLLKVMASSKPVHCGTCQRRKVNTTADIWCYNYDEGLCTSCSGQHKRFKPTSNHKTTAIKSDKPLIDCFKTECDKHNQQLKLYCPSHLTPCCDECFSTHHLKCTGIKSLASVVEKSKIEKSIHYVGKDINSIFLFFNKMANEKYRNIKKGEQQHKIIKESLSKIRKEINQHLNQLEKKLYKEADTVWDVEKSKLTCLIIEIEEKKKTLKEIQDDLHTVTVHTSKLQSFLGIHQI
ncbi:unnamed protein product [Mytilus coruscus]|uniref:B box-type domain-containing protein n=1 Tax=Mytilus coruscus TaxID=42192 RepID=A0A6J8D6T8_MYTCO|nr:unnamed protein product [Mytilus coruscus]